MPKRKRVPGCPMCQLDMEPYEREPLLWVCHFCGLTWNAELGIARALRTA